MVQAIPVVERLLKHSIPEPNSGCWLWLGCPNNVGYGSLLIHGKGYRAHRVSYEVFKGKIPTGLVIDHLCRNRACINPDHLEAVTTQENCLRGQSWLATNAKQRAKTNCPQGHPYDEQNTLLYRNHRYCKTCQAERNRLRCEKLRRATAAKRRAVS